MNEYKFEDIKLNMTEEFTVEITKKMQEDFKANIGDINPIHSDKEFAEKKVLMIYLYLVCLQHHFILN